MTRMVLIALFAALLAPAQAHAAGSTPPAQLFVNPTLYFPAVKKEKGDASDFRPVLSADGKMVIFERTLPKETVANLYIAQLDPSAEPKPFVTTVTVGESGSQRADWCWKRTGPGKLEIGPVAFSNKEGIWIAAANGLNEVPANNISGTAGMIYPAWYPDCKALAVDVVDAGPKVNGRWLTARLDLSTGNVVAPLATSSVWAGFVSVNQANPDLIAFAGQPNNGSALYYNQETNYAWVANRSFPGLPLVRPLQKQAPANLGFLGKYQARAGWWSPDGRWFAFESNRNCNNISGTTYAIFVIDSLGLREPRQVSDCIWNAQHPKWAPPVNGVSTTLIAAVQYKSEGPSQIATFDLSPLILSR